MSVKIKRIDIRAFRGIPDLELELDGKSLVLGGDNGTGKSSIVEALEFFFTGTVAHLEGVQGLSVLRHMPHVHFGPDDARVEIAFDPDNVSLVRTLDSAPCLPRQLEDYLQVTRKGTFILRRSQILEFIMSRPAERFRAIGSIIGIEPLDDVELEMMRVRDHLRGRVESGEARADAIRRELSELLERDITQPEEVLTALNESLRNGNLPTIGSLEEVADHAQRMMRKIKRAEGADQTTVVARVLQAAEGARIPQQLIAELGSLAKRFNHLLHDKVRLRLSVAHLLESGRSLIEQEGMDTCPLCEQTIDREELLSRIDIRLGTVRDLSDEASQVRKASAALMADLQRTCGKVESSLSLAEPVAELCEETERVKHALALLSGVIETVTSAQDLSMELPTEELGQQMGRINEDLSALSMACSQLLESMTLTDQEKEAVRIIGLMEHVRSKTDELLRVTSELAASGWYCQVAETIFSAFSDEKKEKIQGIYDAIQVDVRRFYSMLHPDEPHRDIELAVALGRRASTHLSMESFGRREDPRALASEGHVDSLGLCVFLAFVKKFNEGCSLVVLDDVVTTVDARHRENICKLLHQEFEDRQLILTTHDGVWYEQLCAA